MTGKINSIIKNPPIYWQSYLILFITVSILIVLAFTVGNLVNKQTAIIEAQAAATDRAEERTEELKTDIEELLDTAVESIRQEVRQPAGARAETHEAARRVERIVKQILDRLDEIYD